jgi:hypothetical protein
LHIVRIITATKILREFGFATRFVAVLLSFAKGREIFFDNREKNLHPCVIIKKHKKRPHGSGVEHSLGKGKVTGSNPVEGLQFHHLS